MDGDCLTLFALFERHKQGYPHGFLVGPDWSAYNDNDDNVFRFWG